MTQPNIQHAPGMNTLRPLDANLWQSQLDEAIRSSNDAQMWDLVRQQGDQEEAHEIVATRLSRLAFRIDNKSRYSELFLMPLIDHAGCVVDNADAWKKASHTIGEALDQWLPAKSSKIIFNGVRPFDWVGTWQSKIIRSHLHRAVPGYEQVRLTTVAEKILLPEHAPRLGFVSMVLTSQLGWLSMGQATTLRDKRLRDVVRFSLQGEDDTPPCTVLAPDRVQFAVTDGVCVWLNELNEVVPITGWMVGLVPTTPDVVKITLSLADENVGLTQFTVRRHQIGLRGLDDILCVLNDIAPCMEPLKDGATPKKPSKRP